MPGYVSVALAQAIALIILKCVYECLSSSHSDVKMVSKYRSACWANYTPCLLSVFAPNLASSCLSHSSSLTSHMPAILSPTCVPFYLSLEPSCPLSSVISQMSLRSFPSHFELTSSCLTLSCCCGAPFITVLNL